MLGRGKSKERVNRYDDDDSDREPSEDSDDARMTKKRYSRNSAQARASAKRYL